MPCPVLTVSSLSLPHCHYQCLYHTESAKHILHSKLYSGSWPRKGNVSKILTALLDQYFGHYASLKDDQNSGGIVPSGLYEDKIVDKDAIFIFDGKSPPSGVNLTQISLPSGST